MAYELFRGRYLKVKTSRVSSRTELMTSLRPLDLLQSLQWAASPPVSHLQPYHDYPISLLSYQYQSTSPINQTPMSSRIQQCFDACTALSALLTSHNVPHAFSGGFLTVALGAEPREIEVCLYFLRRIDRSYSFACLLAP